MYGTSVERTVEVFSEKSGADAGILRRSIAYRRRTDFVGLGETAPELTVTHPVYVWTKDVT